MAKKTALEQALLESEQLVTMVAENAKDMFYNQVKSSIEQNLSEGFELDSKDKEDDKITDVPADEVVVTDEPSIEEPSIDEPVGDDASVSSDEPTMDADLTSMGDDTVEVPAMDASGIDDVSDDTVDLTGATDDELISVWKKLGDDAEIQVVKNEDGTVKVNSNGEEFLIKINENEKLISEEFESFNSQFGEPEFGDDEDKYSFLDQGEPEFGDDKIFEIVLDEEEADLYIDPNAPSNGVSTDNNLPPAPQGNPMDNVVIEEQPIQEVARTHSDGRNMTRKPEGFYKYVANRMRPAVNESAVTSKVVINEAQVLRTEKAALLTENDNLKTDLSKHKDALRLMRENLETVALFNSKLAYVNKIMCEHATTTDEKKTILERFDADEITDQKDVKTLYKTISAEMKQTKSIKESVEEKISTSLNGTGEALLESVSPIKSNEDKQLARVKEIMAYQVNKGKI